MPRGAAYTTATASARQQRLDKKLQQLATAEQILRHHQLLAIDPPPTPPHCQYYQGARI